MRILAVILAIVGSVTCVPALSGADERLDTELIVNVVVDQDEAARQSGQATTQEIYKVPRDAWLVVTDVQIVFKGNGELLLLEKAESERVKLHISGQPPEYRSSTGLAFHPGATVVARSWYGAISLTGHLVRVRRP